MTSTENDKPAVALVHGAYTDGSARRSKPSWSAVSQALKVKQSAASTATVHLDQDGDATTFHMHGGGLVISRMVNEFGIAKKVAATIGKPSPPVPPADAAELTIAAPGSSIVLIACP